MSLCWSLDKIGPITRRTTDCAYVLEAVNGVDARDPSSVGVPFASDPAKPVEGLRLGWNPAWFEQAGPAERAVVDHLRSEGCRLVEVDLPDPLPVAPAVALCGGRRGVRVADTERPRRRTGVAAPQALPNTFRRSWFIPAVEACRAIAFDGRRWMPWRGSWNASTPSSCRPRRRPPRDQRHRASDARPPDVERRSDPGRRHLVHRSPLRRRHPDPTRPFGGGGDDAAAATARRLNRSRSMGSSTDQATLRLPVTRRLLRRIVHLAAWASGSAAGPIEAGRGSGRTTRRCGRSHHRPRPRFRRRRKHDAPTGPMPYGNHHVVVPDSPARRARAAGLVGAGASTGDRALPRGPRRLLDRLRIERPILVGSSMGAIALSSPPRARSSLGTRVVGPAGIEPPVDSEVFAAASRDEHMLKVVDRESFDVYALNFVKPP